MNSISVIGQVAATSNTTVKLLLSGVKDSYVYCNFKQLPAVEIGDVIGVSGNLTLLKDEDKNTFPQISYPRVTHRFGGMPETVAYAKRGGESGNVGGQTTATNRSTSPAKETRPDYDDIPF